jgi:hypothetical protein
MECKFNGCSLPVICRGLCSKHSSALYRGQILEDGTPLPHYKPRTITKRCTFEECTRPHHGAGLCNLHRKWLYKGYIDKDHNILNPEKTKEKPKRCKVCKSSKLKGLGFCYSHYCSYKRGVLDLSGERLKPMVRYSKDFVCIVPNCHTKGKMARGMCKRHYNMARLGRIDWQGIEIREPKRVSSYKGKRCRVCNNRARSRGFCHRHYSSYKNGMIDMTGKWLVPKPIRNKGFKCKDSECEREATCKGYCAKHYMRQRTGFVGWKNKGYTCSEEGCGKPATARTLCHNHYRLLRIEEKAQEMLKDNSTNFLIS